MSQQFKTLHFWLGLAVTLLGAALEMHFIPEGRWHNLAMLAMIGFNYAGIATAARWMPPAQPEKQKNREGGRVTIIGIAILAAAGFVMALACTGCGGVIPSLYRTTATAAVVTSSGYRQLDMVDAMHEGEIQSTAEDGRPEEAKKLRDEWRPKYQTARQALDATSVATESALAAIPTIEHAISRDRDARGWIARIAKLTADVAAALRAIGISQPLSGGRL